MCEFVWKSLEVSSPKFDGVPMLTINCLQSCSTILGPKSSMDLARHFPEMDSGNGWAQRITCWKTMENPCIWVWLLSENSVALNPWLNHHLLILIDHTFGQAHANYTLMWYALYIPAIITISRCSRLVIITTY